MGHFFNFACFSKEFLKFDLPSWHFITLLTGFKLLANDAIEKTKLSNIIFIQPKRYGESYDGSHS